MRTILVTGGAGFIGSNLIYRLLEDEDARVVNFDALTYAGNPETLAEAARNPRYSFVHGDICDAALVSRTLAEHRPAALMHLAAESHVDRSIDGPAEFLRTNVIGTFTLLETVVEYWRALPPGARAAFRFLHVSTDEVYGSLGAKGRFAETTQYAPNSPYSASKAASDHLARAWHHTYGLPVVTTNCSNNYGPFQFPEKLIPLIILNALEGSELPVYGDGRQVRDWLYVRDHCEGLLAALARGRAGEVYNLGGDAEMENLAVVRAICALLDELRPDPASGARARLIRHVQDRPGHDRRYAMDSAKARAELGWAPRERFDSGLRKTVIWYLENLDWCKAVQDGTYRRERLGVRGG
jgi:dTDP-glucose 4,6-dehydratase